MGWATHVLQWQLQWEATLYRGVNAKRLPQFELFSATQAHKVGIASNRRSACQGEYVPGPWELVPPEALDHSSTHVQSMQTLPLPRLGRELHPQTETPKAYRS